MSITVNAFNHTEWERHALQDFSDFAEMVEYVNQEPDFGDNWSGDWFYIPNEPLPSGRRVIYFGTFDSYNSPGASSYTYAQLFDVDDVTAFKQWKANCEAAEEYIEVGE